MLTGSPSCSAESETARPQQARQSSAGEAAPVFTYRVVHTYPHDPGAFTQGIVYEDGVLYESTGLRGKSTLRRVELETGKVLQMVSLPPAYFGEGIAVYDQRIIQLTWTSRMGFVWDKKTLNRLDDFRYATEGWGMTQDGERLIMSDGSEFLRFWDPETLEETGQLEVRDRGRPVFWLNELEYIDGEIYANIWQSDRIAIISPADGRVTSWIDLTGILDAADRGPGVDVLNGIAYDAEGDRLFVTGKGWPKLFEIELVPK
jgi:glutamine cyclotransferase